MIQRYEGRKRTPNSSREKRDSVLMSILGRLLARLKNMTHPASPCLYFCLSIRTVLHLRKRKKTTAIWGRNINNTHMCGYVLFLNYCGCCGGFEFETWCLPLVDQLNRINHAESWGPETINDLPFYIPDSCPPSWSNIRIMRTYSVCCPQWWFDCPSVAPQGYSSLVQQWLY